MTKAKCGLLGLGNTTFSDCTKRLMDQGRIRKSQADKNKLYQAVFTPGRPGSLVGEREDLSRSESRSENGSSSHDPVAPAPDKAAQALAFLLNRKPSGVI
jgi:hypothetical protein